MYKLNYQWHNGFQDQSVEQAFCPTVGFFRLDFDKIQCISDNHTYACFNIRLFSQGNIVRVSMVFINGLWLQFNYF